MFWRVTLPNIKWGLLYGVILCNARAMGEFGAVYVVSGHIAGRTDTMPLRVEKLFQEYNNPGLVRRRVGADAAGPRDAGRQSPARTQNPTRPGRSGRNCAMSEENGHEHSRQRRHQAVRHSPRSTTSRSTCRTARCWRCSAPRARARRRCCGSSPGSKSADRGHGAVRRRRRHAAARPAIATSASCFSTTPCSDT